MNYECPECGCGSTYDLNGHCPECGAPMEDFVPVVRAPTRMAQTPAQARMFYYYIAYLTPLGPNSFYYRGDKHPLHPEALEAERKRIATELSLITIKHGGIVPTETIVYTFLMELPIDVANAKWPEEK